MAMQDIRLKIPKNNKDSGNFDERTYYILSVSLFMMKKLSAR